MSASKLLRLPDIARCQSTLTYFVYKRLKYILNPQDNEFQLLDPWDDGPISRIIDSEPLEEDEAALLMELYDSNEIIVPITSIFTLLIAEALSCFYIFQVLSCILWFADEYYQYATCIILISLGSLLWEVYETRKNEKTLHATVCSVGIVDRVRVINGEQLTSSVSTKDLAPGDLIKIPPDGFTMHCDALLLTGNCIVNESSLTGESVPVTKTSFPVDEMRSKLKRLAPQEAKNQKFDLESASRNVLFSGTHVIQTRNFANEPVLALVARTGFKTTRGELIRGILFPKPIEFQFNNDARQFVIFLACLAAIGFFASIFLMVRVHLGYFTIIKRALDLITVIVPPALPVAMTVGVVFAQRRLKKKSLFCVHPSAINLAGVINVTCFDKTGTITEDGLDMWGVVPLDETGSRFSEPLSDVKLKLISGPLMETMTSCHSLTVINGELSGDPLDLKMFQSTNWEFTEETSVDHNKFEMTVPVVVRPRNQPDNQFPAELPYEVGILRQFPFSSSLQCMSVIARVLNQSHFNVYCKGSPEKLETLCRRDTIPSDFHSLLLDYTREGYRVLALAWRPLKLSYPKALKIPREQVERKLRFLGLLVMENRLKPESADVILTLKAANIRPIMVTGDNMLTALSVARDCEMIDEQDKVIVVSAKAPPNAEDDYILQLDQSSNNATDANWEHLVEFHYAEDLQRPVMEVTTATNLRSQKRSTKQAKRRWKTNRDPRAVSRMHQLKNWMRFNRFSSTIVEVTSLTESAEGYGSMEAGLNSVSAAGEPNTLQPPHPHLTIRMLDHPDFHLAISGKTWATIHEYFPSLIPKLVVKGTVFARFSPDQKMQLIEALQSVGYYVSMCGDGANDCGALKAAHAGISLSEAEASVASGFTSRVQNISCVPLLIREGRCALATSFGIFKFMAGYSITQFISVILLHSIGTTLSDSQFLYVDLFLITTLGVTFSYTQAYHKLEVGAPCMRLFSAVTLSSLCSQLLLNLLIQLAAFFYVQAQPWYKDYVQIDPDKYEYYNYDISSLFIVSVYQYIILAIVFSKGAPYRKSIISNRIFLLNLAATIVLTLVITVYPIEALTKYYSLMSFPVYETQAILLGFVIFNVVFAHLFEFLIDGVAFQRRVRKLRTILFPQKVQRKDYERIRDEIERMAGQWPPLIRSASVQDIRGDLFQGPMRVDTQRHRHASSCTDDESDNLTSPIVSPPCKRETAMFFANSQEESAENEMPKQRKRSSSLNPQQVTLGPLQLCKEQETRTASSREVDRRISDAWRRRTKSSDARHVLCNMVKSEEELNFPRLKI
ncbi:hypothetical protein Ciccas_000270 [Cichlidogyrus casuarinus]|uniref:P-type ATPase A domain-containing protein n=1 Tax=Cichlidogyrus casuarinus TaxID=1844966 RepID=A0ABD2QND4_9PLAT